MHVRRSRGVGALSAHALFAAGALAAVLAGARAARAEPTQAEADVQFDWGLSEMKAGRFHNGCPAIAESYRLDPKPGALFTLAECEARWGRSSSALTHYEAYLDLFAHMSAEQQEKQRGREIVSREQKRALLPRVPELAIQLPPDAPPDTVVKRDGVILSAASLGTLAPVDPGEHVITAEWSGGAAEQRVKLSDGEKLRVTVAIAPPRAVVVAPRGLAPDAAETPSRGQPIAPQESAAPSRAPVYAAGAVGVAGLIVGGVAGVVAISDKATVDAHCQGNLCDPQGKTAADSLKSAALVSTVGFAVGIVAVGTVIVLLLLEPKRTRAAHLEVAPSANVPDLDTRGLDLRGLRLVF